MLTQNDIETQLTQRRLDNEAQQLLIKQLQAQIQSLKQLIADSTSATSNSSSSNGLVGIVNTTGPSLLVTVKIVFNQLATFATTTFNGLATFALTTFNSLATFAAGLLSQSDVTIYKGVGNTSNLIVGQDITHKRFKIAYVDNSNFSVINSFDNGVYTPCSLDASPLGINANSLGNIVFGASTSLIGFFGAAAIGRQTRNIYTTNVQGSPYGGIATGVAGTPYAQLTDLNNLRVAYENLRASYDDLRTKVGTSTLMA